MILTKLEDWTIITPCDQCYFFNGDCKLGRREMYQKQGLLDGNNILTFCNYARDPELIEKGYDPKQVDYDNRIKYDLIVRVDKSLEIEKLDRFISLSNPPSKIILSYIDIDKNELFQKISNTKLEALKIFNPERRLELEYQATSNSWFQVIDLCDFDENIVQRLEYKINNEIDRIICVVGHIYNSIFCKWLVANDLQVCDDNILNIKRDLKSDFIREAI